MTILITSATGSIGSLVVHEALRKGHAVRALVRSLERARQLPREAEVVIGDITRPETLVAATDRVDAVVFTSVAHTELQKLGKGDRPLKLLAAGLILLSQLAWPQSVKLANVALGMNEAEVKTALSSSSPFYIERDSESPELRYLVAESREESFAFIFIGGKVAAFSLMHILPPGQQPFLPLGQQPTVSTLRSLVTKQTWTPAEIRKGETLWLSDSTGAPLSDASNCTLQSGEAWLPFGPVQGANKDEPPAPSTAGLRKPSLTAYPPGCGVSIHLDETPARSEDDRVTSVRIQVLDIKAMNAFLAKAKL